MTIISFEYTFLTFQMFKIVLVIEEFRKVNKLFKQLNIIQSK